MSRVADKRRYRTPQSYVTLRVGFETTADLYPHTVCHARYAWQDGLINTERVRNVSPREFLLRVTVTGSGATDLDIMCLTCKQPLTHTPTSAPYHHL